MGGACSLKHEAAKKSANEQTNRTTNRTIPSNMAQTGYAPQQMSRPGYPPQPMPASNDANQQNLAQRGYQGKANNIGNTNNGYTQYRTAPSATNRPNSGYQPNNAASKAGDQERYVQNFGNQNLDFQTSFELKKPAYPSAMVNRNDPVRPQNYTAVGQQGYHNSGNQDGRYQNVAGNHKAPNLVNATDRPVTGNAPRAGNYQANYQGVGQAGTHHSDSRNYLTGSSARNDGYPSTGLQNMGYKTTATSVGHPPNASSCNCDVVDPPSRVKVYDPLVNAYVYEVDENTEIQGFPDTNLTQSVNQQAWGAVDHTGGIQSKYGVINAPPSRS